MRNFFCYSIMKIMPELFQKSIYDFGLYNNLSVKSDDEAPVATTQTTTGMSIASGVKKEFMD